MCQRITQNTLELMVKRLNNIVGFESPDYGEIGSYTISYAYGEASLYKYVNKHGGVSDVFRSGHITKHELYYRIDAYIQGMLDK